MNILVVDDHPLYRSGVVYTLQNSGQDINVTECPVVDAALANDDPAVVRECIELGAYGFLPKSAPSEEFHAALALVLAGGVYLPPTSLSVAAPATRAQQDAWTRLGARLTD